MFSKFVGIPSNNRFYLSLFKGFHQVIIDCSTPYSGIEQSETNSNFFQNKNAVICNKVFNTLLKWDFYKNEVALQFYIPDHRSLDSMLVSHGQLQTFVFTTYTIYMLHTYIEYIYLIYIQGLDFIYYSEDSSNIILNF